MLASRGASRHARCAVEAKRGDALGRLRNNPPDEKDPPEQTATATFTPHAFKTTPRITFRRSGAIGAFATDLDKRRRCGPRDGRHGSRRRPPGAPDAETCTSHSKVQFQPSFSSAKCTPRVQNAHLGEEGAGRPGGSREGRPDTAFRTPHSGDRASCSTDRPFLTPSTLTVDPHAIVPHGVGTRPGPDAVRRSDGLSPPMPDRAGFITLTG